MPMLGEMWASMALTGRVVIIVLALLSTYSLGLVVERLLALRWARERTERFAAEAQTLSAADLKALARSDEFGDFTSLAAIVGEGLEDFDRAHGEDGADGDTVMEVVQESVRRGLDVAAVNLRAHLTSLATVAGVAPFLGLFGTVTGLISAFRGIAETGGGGLAAVSSGVSEALVTTVIGLFVAMPALWAYNYFSQRVEVLLVDMDNAAHRILNGVVRTSVRLSGRTSSSGRRESRAAEGGVQVSALPDITPIVNVALVLLIIFMIVTPMIREGVPVETPTAQTVEQLQESSQAVILSVQNDGSMFVNLKPVDDVTLQAELSLAYRGQEGKPVVIKGAENLPYGEILELMDACKQAGAPSVDLVAERID